jgi:hypothetical protein
MKIRLNLLLSIVFLFCAVSFGQKTEPVTTGETKPADKKTAPAVTNAVKLPSAAEIIEKYVAAIGGRAANEKIKTRVTKGTVELAPMGIRGTAETFQAAPDKSYAKTTLGGIGEIIEAFDGKNAWSVNPLQGNRDKTGDELVQTKLLNNFYRDINLEKLYPKMEVKGIEKVGDREAYVVVATPEGLEPETFYFDVKSGYLLRSDTVYVSPEGKMPVKTFFEDFREVDGIKIAYKVRAVMPQFELITVLTEIKHNVTVEDGLFAKPK